MARILHAAMRDRCVHSRRGHMMPRYGQPWQKLHALAVAIDAAALREPYPRLARLMESLAVQQTAMRAAGPRAIYG